MSETARKIKYYPALTVGTLVQQKLNIRCTRAYGKIIPAVYVDLWELLSATAFGGLVSFWCILLLDGQLFIIGRE